MMPALTDDALKVLDGITLSGRVNVEDDRLRAHIRSSIRRGHPQVRPQPMQPDRVALVGGGPSLADTERELVELVHAGAKLVTVNGAYHWCLARNLRPSAQIVLDARAGNARFVVPTVPRCRYLIASQAHPATWDAVDGEDVWIFHAVAKDEPAAADLDAYYLQQWQGIVGGTTVVMRGLSLLRTLGFVRFDLFGVDSCILHDAGHAYAQPENDADQRLTVYASPIDRPNDKRAFVCTPAHLKQCEDFLQLIRIAGDHFLLNVHGDGLLAYMLRESAVVV